MQKIVLTIDCPNCDTKIKKQILNLSDNNEIDVFMFSQTEWECPNCEKLMVSIEFKNANQVYRQYVIGDIDIYDSDDL